MNNNLYSIDDTISLNRKDLFKHYKEYVNPGLASLLSLLDFDKNYIKAEGVRVWDSDNNEYLDFLGGYGSLNLGHNPVKIIEAINKVTNMPNILQASLNKFAAALAHNISKITPGDLNNTFFCNSGAEAIEGAIKTSRIYTGKTIIISCENSFHGKTMGSLSITGRKKYQEQFTPLIPECKTVPYGNVEELEAVLEKQNVAAFIVEPIQGEAGIIVPPEGYLRKAREICSRYNTLLVFDEIQTGFGRTGNMFVCNEEKITPDILCMAKSLGGGVVPLGAFTTTKEIWSKAYGSMENCLLHTSTFGGNTVAMAAGIESINQIIEQGLSENASKKGDYFLEKLKKLKDNYEIIHEVRGKGLMIGIEFKQIDKNFLNKISGGALSKLAQEYTGAMIAAQLLNDYRIITAYTLNNPNVIRLAPPLVVEYDHIDKVVESLDDIFNKNKSFYKLSYKTAKTAISSFFGR